MSVRQPDFREVQDTPDSEGYVWAVLTWRGTAYENRGVVMELLASDPEAGRSAKICESTDASGKAITCIWCRIPYEVGER